MNKIILTLLFSIVIAEISFSQNLEQVDAIVLKYPSSFKSTKTLAKRIDNDFKTDLEKVRASYTWITENIAYSYDEQKATTKIYKSYKNDIKLSNDMSRRVLKTKEAICSGYSQLFQNLMIELNIKSRIVNGSAKTEIKDIGKRLSIDHAWNIVVIDGNKFLIDTTWGAGIWNNGFIKDRNYIYFMTPPELFAINHYPKNQNDLLLSQKITKSQFANQPLIYSDLLMDVKLIEPKEGILDRQAQRGIYHFNLETKLKIDWISCNLGKKNITPEITPTKTGYKFTVNLNKNIKAKSLIIYFNGQALAEYLVK